MKFCSHVLRLTGDCSAAEAIETYVYNGLVGAMKPDGTGFSYVNLLDGVKTTNTGWGWEFGGFRVTCCNLNGPMGLAYIPYVAVMRPVRHLPPRHSGMRLPAAPPRRRGPKAASPSALAPIWNSAANGGPATL